MMFLQQSTAKFRPIKIGSRMCCYVAHVLQSATRVQFDKQFTNDEIVGKRGDHVFDIWALFPGDRDALWRFADFETNFSPF
jgi:hypothetical protein